MRGILRDTFRGLLARPVRTLLQWVTFGLGFALVLMVVAGLEGGRSQIRESLYNLGVDVIAVFNPLEVKVSHLPRIGDLPAARLAPTIKIGTAGDRLIDRQAYLSLRQELGGDVRQVLPFGIEMTSIEYVGFTRNTTLMTTRPGFAEILRTGLLAGRFLREDDEFVSGGISPVALDEALARDFAKDDPGSLVGKVIPFTRGGTTEQGRVVGIVTDPIVLRQHLNVFDSQASARTLSARRLEFTNLYLPFRVEEDRLQGIIIQAHGAEDIAETERRLDTFFEERGIVPYYHVMKHWVESVLEVVERASLLLHFFWVVSLIVLIVISGTIALLAVEERYPEIAIQRVEGAPIARVVTALLGEGIILALASLPLGAAIGHLLWHGWPAIGIDGLGVAIGFEPALSPGTFVTIGALLLVTGAMAYVLPAYRLAKLPPAYALGRFEN